MPRGSAAVRMSYEGHTYQWTGKTWIDAECFETVSLALGQQLNALAASQLEAADDELTTVEELLDAARQRREGRNLTMALKLTERAVVKQPGNAGANATLCAILRDLGRSKEALEKTDHMDKVSSAPLLTTRAAACCDIEEWARAKRIVGRALAIRKDGEAFAVARRIKSVRPDLYDK